MSGGFFRGTSADQDSRFSNKQAKLLKTHKFPSELDQSVDIAKVKMDVIKPWIATRVTELLGFEDEVLINFIYGLLEGKNMDGKQIQIQLTGFMEKNTSKFMKELWGLLISAQNNSSGVPQQFLDAKQLEIQKKKEESEKIMEEIQKKREKEKAEEESERKNKRADETLIPNQELQDNKDSISTKLNTNNSPRSRSNSPSRRRVMDSRRRRSPSGDYRRRRYGSPDLREPSRRFSPPSRRRFSPPPPQRKRKSEIVRDRKVISSPIESARYKRRHESPDEEPVPRSRKSEIVRKYVHEPSESPDERENHEYDDYVPRRKSKDENKEYVMLKRYEIKKEEEYEPRSFKKEQKGKMNEFTSDSEFQTEKIYKGKRKVKKYSDESSESESEREEEFKKKRRERERHLKKEDKREKHKKKNRVRNEDFEDEESEEKERQKRLEVELREKALQSLRAKKGSSNH